MVAAAKAKQPRGQPRKAATNRMVAPLMLVLFLSALSTPRHAHARGQAPSGDAPSCPIPLANEKSQFFVNNAAMMRNVVLKDVCLDGVGIT